MKRARRCGSERKERTQQITQIDRICNTLVAMRCVTRTRKLGSDVAEERMTREEKPEVDCRR
jgi:hypothetical protein